VPCDTTRYDKPDGVETSRLSWDAHEARVVQSSTAVAWGTRMRLSMGVD
jgi:hypothetical protein